MADEQNSKYQVEWRATVRYSQPFEGGVAYGVEHFTVLANANITTAHRIGLKTFYERHPSAQAIEATYTRHDLPERMQPERQPTLW